jgi:hypothetical protein
MPPSLGRSSVPSSFKISGPNVDAIFLSVRVPGRTTSRARTSASMTGMLRAASCLETVDFPVAMPPVRPMTITWLELWIVRGQVCIPNIPGLGEGPGRPPLPFRMGHPHFLTLTLNPTQSMSVALQHVPTINGLNGASTESKKAKSRNQLRRQKAKLKKSTTQVCPSPSLLHSGSVLMQYKGRDTRCICQERR